MTASGAEFFTMNEVNRLKVIQDVVAALKLRTTNKSGRHLSTGRALQLMEDYGDSIGPGQGPRRAAERSHGGPLAFPLPSRSTSSDAGASGGKISGGLQ